MGRSVKKGPFVEERLFEKVAKSQQRGSYEAIRTWARRCTIVPEFVGRTFEVHNGNKFLKVYVTEDMVGHKLGEFSPTRQFRGHTGVKKEEKAATPAS